MRRPGLRPRSAPRIARRRLGRLRGGVSVCEASAGNRTSERASAMARASGDAPSARIATSLPDARSSSAPRATVRLPSDRISTTSRATTGNRSVSPTRSTSGSVDGINVVLSVSSTPPGEYAPDPRSRRRRAPGLAHVGVDPAPRWADGGSHTTAFGGALKAVVLQMGTQPSSAGCAQYAKIKSPLAAICDIHAHRSITTTEQRLDFRVV